MNKKYYYLNCLGFLEDKLPPDLFEQVKGYIVDETIENAGKYTQTERVYRHLLEHGSITNMQ